ncbi:MAG TPA: ROK family protein [Phnomibacter sp.]|nr:ROK family protein [Phnomibacter sp.]
MKNQVANKRRIGIDIGGTHITTALVDTQNTGKETIRKSTTALNANASANSIINTLTQSLKDILDHEADVDALGIAIPGPFDYEKGVCAIANVGGKFEQAFGLHIHQALKDMKEISGKTISFSNDAKCFAAGYYHLQQLTSKRTVFLTLGTGFGSAFIRDGILVANDSIIPESGAFYDQEFCGGIADDFFSSRWILKTYKKKSGITPTSVKELAENPSAASIEVWNEFGTNLGSFLLPWLKKFGCDELVIGGNIAKALPLFYANFYKELEEMTGKMNIVGCNDTDECIVVGAAITAGKKTGKEETLLRKCLQEVLPVSIDTNNANAYNIYPSFSSNESVHKGFSSLAQEIGDAKIVVIDGYGGVLWESFRTQLHEAIRSTGKTVYWYDVSACLKHPADIQDMIAQNLNGDDPVFGKRYEGNLADFFEADKLQLISPDPAADLCIVYGTGAALTGIQGKLLYVDVPKNEIQFRMRAGSIGNIGSCKMSDAQQMYKRFYFVDWPMLNKHKAALLPQLDCMIDEQRIHEITWMKGNALRITLHQMLQQPVRARPWFEPGIWGGDWMKKRIAGLNQNAVNYAWSFELITPENGIVIEGNGNLLEISFDCLLYADNTKLLGKAAKRFGYEFPIRFDFLDTYNGGNLSIQCHPRPTYIKENFGENFTQDETYYILDCEPGADVYLGFQEGIQPDAFKDELLDAQQNGKEIDIVQYVQKLPAQKHDLFLIPSGTVHASGKNNLVLEISSTPYIFTFKMYDWQRLDLNGKPRPINIEHAFNNLCFDRQADYVSRKLVSHPLVEAEWTNGRKLQLPTHAEHFYTVDRYEFTGSINIPTNGQCHICMLVEGDAVEVLSNNNTALFQYAETFVVPAAAGEYQLTQKGNKKAFVVVAYVKDECC